MISATIPTLANIVLRFTPRAPRHQKKPTMKVIYFIALRKRVTVLFAFGLFGLTWSRIKEITVVRTIIRRIIAMTWNIVAQLNWKVLDILVTSPKMRIQVPWISLFVSSGRNQSRAGLVMIRNRMNITIHAIT